MGRPPKTDEDALPHPAEDLSADDDLLSWILVDQLGCLPNTKLGVHPQQVKFVGPTFKTEDVMNIVHDTVIKGNIALAMQQLQEFYLIKGHIESKKTEGQRDRFIQHLRRYLLPLLPNSRVDIHTTDRYSFITGHPELAVYATRPLAPQAVLHELQGSVVPLPDQWRTEMEIGEGFAVEAAGEESESESEDDDEASVTSSRRDRARTKDADKKQRRSDRTKRRDFSIVWSGLKRCFQLFLGPARFLNHDCSPNVELLRQGKYVTFRVIRQVRIGEELTTFYGENYFGKGNIECLCLTCEQKNVGGFTPKENSRRSSSRAGSVSSSWDTPNGTPGKLKSRPSGLRHSIRPEDSEDEEEAGPSGSRESVLGGSDKTADPSATSTLVDSPTAVEGEGEAEGLSKMGDEEEVEDSGLGEAGEAEELLEIESKVDADGDADADADEAESSGSDSESSIEIPRSQRLARQAVKNAKPWSFFKRSRKRKNAVEEETPASAGTEDEELPEDFPRCATCAKGLTERIWYQGRYFDHCARCTRHALIFELPWPAHQIKDVQAYPPAHLVPNGYIPKRISTIPLPSLTKKKKEIIVIPPIVESSSSYGQGHPDRISREIRRQLRLRAEIDAEEFVVESLRVAEWNRQDAKEQALVAAAEAKIEAKRAREEAKRKKNENKIRGSGVWTRYEYISVEEAKKREEARHAVTSGTRRGGRFRDNEDEEAMKELAEKRKRKEMEKLKAYRDLAAAQAEEDERRAQESGKEEEQDDEGTADVLIPTPSTGRRNVVRPADGSELDGEEESDDDDGEISAESGSEDDEFEPSPRDRPRAKSTRETPKRKARVHEDDDEEHRPSLRSNDAKQRSSPVSENLPAGEQPVQPKRRGRPPGTGHLQRARAIAEARTIKAQKRAAKEESKAARAATKAKNAVARLKAMADEARATSTFLESSNALGSSDEHAKRPQGRPPKQVIPVGVAGPSKALASGQAGSISTSPQSIQRPAFNSSTTTLPRAQVQPLSGLDKGKGKAKAPAPVEEHVVVTGLELPDPESDEDEGEDEHEGYTDLFGSFPLQPEAIFRSPSPSPTPDYPLPSLEDVEHYIRTAGWKFEDTRAWEVPLGEEGTFVVDIERPGALADARATLGPRVPRGYALGPTATAVATTTSDPVPAPRAAGETFPVIGGILLPTEVEVSASYETSPYVEYATQLEVAGEVEQETMDSDEDDEDDEIEYIPHSEEKIRGHKIRDSLPMIPPTASPTKSGGVVNGTGHLLGSGGSSARPDLYASGVNGNTSVRSVKLREMPTIPRRGNDEDDIVIVQGRLGDWKGKGRERAIPQGSPGYPRGGESHVFRDVQDAEDEDFVMLPPGASIWDGKDGKRKRLSEPGPGLHHRDEKKPRHSFLADFLSPDSIAKAKRFSDYEASAGSIRIHQPTHAPAPAPAPAPSRPVTGVMWRGRSPSAWAPC
ncbi:Histone-lysine N-methyltransferase set9 [Saitozyma podzolica]|uniref:Histone-lysine N-methyltransferase set9 n=1 Tax=Saitozyma podzolica TaxID=1890683 RepID=A0A427YN99_9TREE|nr:Histone-lysine N-methyltransferase set9 [Saitozyma podzolica]